MSDLHLAAILFLLMFFLLGCDKPAPGCKCEACRCRDCDCPPGAARLECRK